MRKYLYAVGMTIVLGSGAAYLLGPKSAPSTAAEIKTPRIDVHELHKTVDVKRLSAQAYAAF